MEARLGPRLKLGRSVARETAEGIEFFPGFADYENALREAGMLASGESLRDRHELLGPVMHHWVRRGQTGCQFAKRLAGEPHRFGWVDLVIVDHRDPEVPRALESFLASQSEAEAVLVVLPSIGSVDALIEFFLSLCLLDSWRCVRVEPDPAHPPDDDTHTVVGFRWRPPQEAKESWPLVFAPLEDLPFTRRAPITAMVLRTHSPLPESEGIDLAAMDAHLPAMKFERAGKHTKAAKARLLRGELLSAARARVTLRVPAESLSVLGIEDP